MEEYKGIQISQSISDKSLFYNVETDSVQNPQYYSGGIQPIEFMQAQLERMIKGEIEMMSYSEEELKGIVDYQCALVSDDGDSTSPQHYRGNIQPIEFMQAQMSCNEFIGFLKGNIIKYVTRAGRKKDTPAIEDLNKAKCYLNWLCEVFEGKTINPRK